jgi:magnesium chelatase family protein
VRVVINLALAYQRKEEPAFDLPIALGLIVTSGQLDRPKLDGLWCAGELGLDGSLRPCRGVIALADLAMRQGARALVVTPANATEAALIPNLNIWTAHNLKELVQQLKGECPFVRIGDHPSPQKVTPAAIPPELVGLGMEGMERAAHALALAAAGGASPFDGWATGMRQNPFGSPITAVASTPQHSGVAHHLPDSLRGRGVRYV